MNPTELYVKKEDGEYKASTIFFCEKCKFIHREKYQAEACCQPRKPPEPKPCTYCGKPVDVGNFTYAPLHHDECKLEDQMSKAKEVEPSAEDQMFYDPYHERYEADLEMIMDYYYADDLEERPEFCFACKPNKFELKLDSAIETAFDDHYCEDGDYPTFEHLEDIEELEEFVAKWNAKQTIVTYEPDYSRKIRLEWGET